MTPELERLLPDDLQELVSQFGGYDKISAEAWAEYEERLVATFEWLAAHHKVKDCDRVSDPLRGVWRMIPRRGGGADGESNGESNGRRSSWRKSA